MQALSAAATRNESWEERARREKKEEEKAAAAAAAAGPAGPAGPASAGTSGGAESDVEKWERREKEHRRSKVISKKSLKAAVCDEEGAASRLLSESGKEGKEGKTGEGKAGEGEGEGKEEGDSQVCKMAVLFGFLKDRPIRHFTEWFRGVDSEDHDGFLELGQVRTISSSFLSLRTISSSPLSLSLCLPSTNRRLP